MWLGHTLQFIVNDKSLSYTVIYRKHTEQHHDELVVERYHRVEVEAVESQVGLSVGICGLRLGRSEIQTLGTPSSLSPEALRLLEV